MPNIRKAYQWNKEEQQWEYEKPTTKGLIIFVVLLVLMFSLVSNVFLIKENKYLKEEIENYEGQPDYFQFQD